MNDLGHISDTAVTLFGWPATDRPATGIEVLGIPSDSGNVIESGGRFGPDSIRRASLPMGWRGTGGFDHGDVDFVHRYDWPNVLEKIEHVIDGIAARNSLPVVLGGDHAISYATVAGLHRMNPLNILWFDAHTDFCAWPGDACHDHKQVLRRISGLRHVNRILQIGHRGITYFDESRLSPTMSVVTAGAAATLTAEAILEFLPAGQPVYVSVDIDAVDPKWAPGTGHPVPGGLSAALLVDLARVAIKNRNVVGLDLMEVNPMLDHEGITSMVAASILSELLSELARQRSEH